MNFKELDTETTIADDLASALETGIVTKRLGSFLLAQFYTFKNFEAHFRGLLMGALDVSQEDVEQNATPALMASLPPVDGFRAYCNAILYEYGKKINKS